MRPFQNVSEVPSDEDLAGRPLCTILAQEFVTGVASCFSSLVLPVSSVGSINKRNISLVWQ